MVGGFLRVLSSHYFISIQTSQTRSKAYFFSFKASPTLLLLSDLIKPILNLQTTRSNKCMRYIIWIILQQHIYLIHRSNSYLILVMIGQEVVDLNMRSQKSLIFSQRGMKQLIYTYFMIHLYQFRYTLQYSILGYHMRQVKNQPEGHPKARENPWISNLPSRKDGEVKDRGLNPHLAFEKNYPKNIFITLIEHLAEVGLKQTYQECVGTRASFESKNVVSLAEIHKVISQTWFRESINITALVSNMSNKILMNSKIKKKLFHLLLIKELFALPTLEVKEFKKQVSRIANQISNSQMANHPLFNSPSALIYLLKLFSQGLQKDTRSQYLGLSQITVDEDPIRQSTSEEGQLFGPKLKEASSKQQSKHYISKIISHFNHHCSDLTELLDKLQQIKFHIQEKQEEIRLQYQLPKFVPEWTLFNSMVIDNCFLAKKNKQKLTFSVVSQWIQSFRELVTSHRGFIAINKPWQEDIHKFRPIILILPPVQKQ